MDSASGVAKIIHVWYGTHCQMQGFYEIEKALGKVWEGCTPPTQLGGSDPQTQKPTLVRCINYKNAVRQFHAHEKTAGLPVSTDTLDSTVNNLLTFENKSEPSRRQL